MWVSRYATANISYVYTFGVSVHVQCNVCIKELQIKVTSNWDVSYGSEVFIIEGLYSTYVCVCRNVHVIMQAHM